MFSFIRSHIPAFSKFLNLWTSANKKLQDEPVCKIINTDTCEKTGRVLLYVQKKPTHVVGKYYSIDLAGDDDLLELFSPLDVRTIVYLACKESTNFDNYQYSILRVYQKEGICFLSYTNKLKEKIDKPINEVSKDKDLLSGFSPMDAHMIGYVSCESSMGLKNLNNSEVIEI